MITLKKLQQANGYSTNDNNNKILCSFNNLKSRLAIKSPMSIRRKHRKR